MAGPDSRERSIFINCPFDHAFASMFDAIVFTCFFCGFTVRSALEISDSGDLRLAKIIRLIEQSRFSIHDISRVELDSGHGLPRFNMPIELGIALGMKHLGRAKLRDHALLVLDSEKFRYRKFASDLAGIDVATHQSEPADVVKVVRNFLVSHCAGPLPGPEAIAAAQQVFEDALPTLAAAARQKPEELTFVDRLRHLGDFIGSRA